MLQQIILIILILLLSGMILGISFLESWIKFRAPSLTRAIGLDVGRTVFNAFHKVQAIFLVLIIMSSFFSLRAFFTCALVVSLTAIFLIQTLSLLPRLNQRVELILKNKTLPKSTVHIVYGALELCKLFLLLWLAIHLLLHLAG